MRRRDFVTRIGATIILALGLSPLALPTALNAQKAAGVKRVGWLEVCGPGPKRPHFDIFRAHLAELGYVEGKTSSSSSDLQIANTTGCRGWPLSSYRFQSTLYSPWARERRESPPKP